MPYRYACLTRPARRSIKSTINIPVLGMAPTSRWQQGEVVGDYYEIQLPLDLAPGTYRWGVPLYRSLPDGGRENLQVRE